MLELYHRTFIHFAYSLCLIQMKHSSEVYHVKTFSHLFLHMKKNISKLWVQVENEKGNHEAQQ